MEVRKELNKLGLSQDEKEVLATNNLKLVYYLAQKYHNHDYEEIVGAGMEGLARALNAFDETKNTKFSTYAYRAINNQMLMYIRGVSGVSMVSIDEPIANGAERELTLADMLVDTKVQIEDMLVKKEANKMIVESMIKLPRDEQFIFYHFYGVFGKPKLTQVEISKNLSISQARVSKTVKKILSKLNKDIGERLKTQATR